MHIFPMRPVKILAVIAALATQNLPALAQDNCNIWAPSQESVDEYLNTYGMSVFRLTSNRTDRTDGERVRGTATLFHRDQQSPAGQPQYAYFLTAKHTISSSARTLEEVRQYVQDLKLHRVASDNPNETGWIYLEAEVVGWPADEDGVDLAILRADMSKPYRHLPDAATGSPLSYSLGRAVRPVPVSFSIPSPNDRGAFIGYRSNTSGRGLSGASFVGMEIDHVAGLSTANDMLVEDTQSGSLVFSRGNGIGVLRNYGANSNEETASSDDLDNAIAQRLRASMTLLVKAKPLITRSAFGVSEGASNVIQVLSSDEPSKIEADWRFVRAGHAECLRPLELFLIFSDVTSDREKYRTLYNTKPGLVVFLDFMKFLDKKGLSEEAGFLQMMFAERMVESATNEMKANNVETALSISANLSKQAASAVDWYGSIDLAKPEINQAEDFYIHVVAKYPEASASANTGVAASQAAKAHAEFASLKLRQHEAVDDPEVLRVAVSAVREAVALDTSVIETPRAAREVFRHENELRLAAQAIRSEYAITQDPALVGEWNEMIGQRGSILPWVEAEKLIHRTAGIERGKQLTSERIERIYDKPLLDMRAVALSEDYLLRSRETIGGKF